MIGKIHIRGSLVTGDSILIQYEAASSEGSVLHKQGWRENYLLVENCKGNSPVKKKILNAHLIYSPLYNQKVQRTWSNIFTYRTTAKTNI